MANALRSGEPLLDLALVAHQLVDACEPLRREHARVAELHGVDDKRDRQGESGASADGGEDGAH